MKLEVLLSMLREKEFVVIDEDNTAEEILEAVGKMKNGHIVLYDIFMIQLTERGGAHESLFSKDGQVQAVREGTHQED